MRHALAPLLFVPALALAAPDALAPFEPALAEVSVPNNETLVDDSALELLKRATGCATGYAACININQPGLCCRTNQVCSADAAGHAACCQTGAVCTGTINPVQTGTTISITSTGTGAASTTTTNFVLASSTTGTAGTTTSSSGTFIQSSAANPTARSTVSNQYYPFPYIPTTYLNAAACSAAYTSCQSDAASCTAALATGRQGVTVSAPNGGVTVTAIASLGASSASSICSSLSLAACSGLQVEACQAFGTKGAAPTRCAGMYRVGAGVAVGIAGQLLR